MTQKKTIVLLAVFLIVFFVAGISIGIYSITYSVSNHLDSIDLPPQSKLILGIILLLVFDPMLLLICWYAKQEHFKSLGIVAFVLLLFISACVLSEIFSIL